MLTEKPIFTLSSKRKFPRIKYIYFNEVYDIMTDTEKKALISLFIDKIEICTEKQPDGRRVRQIDFQFSVILGDDEGDRIIFPSLPDKCGSDLLACGVHRTRNMILPGIRKGKVLDGKMDNAAQ